MNRRSVLLIGASGGIGSAIQSDLQEHGWEIVAPSRVDLDLSDPDSIVQFVESFEYEIPEAIVFAAGINKPRSLNDTSLDDWSEMMMVNLTSFMLILRYFCPKMGQRGHGKVVAISSSYALVSRPGRSAYSAAKAGLESLVRSAAIEFATSGILVNCVSPGFVDTPLTARNNSSDALAKIVSEIPIGRLGTGSEIAHLVRYLISEENTYITGQRVQIDGGFLAC